jgi:hypothetical protein
MRDFGHVRRVVGRGSAVDEARANFISPGCKLPSLIRLERTVASMQPGEEMQRERDSVAGGKLSAVPRYAAAATKGRIASVPWPTPTS